MLGHASEVCHMSACVLVLPRRCQPDGHENFAGVSGVLDMCGIKPGVTMHAVQVCLSMSECMPVS